MGNAAFFVGINNNQNCYKVGDGGLRHGNLIIGFDSEVIASA